MALGLQFTTHPLRNFANLTRGRSVQAGKTLSTRYRLSKEKEKRQRRKEKEEEEEEAEDSPAAPKIDVRRVYGDTSLNLAMVARY